MRFGDEEIGLKGPGVTAARVVSRLTVAPLIDLYVGTLISFTSPIGLGPVLSPIMSLLLCLVLMVILPPSPIVYAAYKGEVDLDVSEQSERTRFFLFAIVAYFVAVLVFWWFQCLAMMVLAAAYVTVTIGVMIGNRFTKVSVHTAGIGGPGTGLIYMYGLVALPVVFVWLVVVWSRTTLQQHTLNQSLLGVLLSVVITWITYAVLYIG